MPITADGVMLLELAFAVSIAQCCMMFIAVKPTPERQMSALEAAEGTCAITTVVAALRYRPGRPLALAPHPVWM